ncbi:MAG: ABC transporter ATP-binding protein [Oscillospiraceae bacterium]|nr:ABC transporter ATP-binding protein [Oscillospiraceae bacterium]
MIEVSGLTKYYGVHTAIRDLNFTIERGHIYGFLGPNGAGKTTTMNIVTGCLAATSGNVKIGGFDIFEDAKKAKKLLGYLPEQPPVYPDMTPYEYLDFVAAAKGVDRSETEAQKKQVSELTQITDVKDRLIRNLSKGYRQRVGIAQALIGSPEVIILDEPTVGLDPKQITEMRELIKSLGKEHTVILSSHILSEVRAVCDHVMIISHGSLAASDTPENLESYFTGSTTVKLKVKAPEDKIKSALEKIDACSGVKFAEDVSGLTDVSLSVKDNADIREAVFFAFSAAGLPILEMNTVKASLEDVFIELTAEKPENEAEPGDNRESAAPDGKKEVNADESDI